MALSAPVRLPARLLAALVDREGLGELHPTLATAPTWRDTHDPVNDEQLTALGWRDRDGSLDREVASSLAVLCRPDVAYYGWLTHRGTTTAVLAAAIAREGVLAVRRADGTIRLRGVCARRLAQRLVGQLPGARPGVGVPLVVPLSELHAAGRDVLRVRRLLGLPVTGSGELYAGRRAEPLCYVDTVAGRYAVMILSSGCVRVGPADEPALVAQLDGLR